MRRALHSMVYSCLRAWWRLRRPLTLGARVIAVKDDEVLLVKMTYVPGWHLPGGGVDKGETLEEAARRELHEECGAVAGGLELFGVYFSTRYGKNDHIGVFVARDPEMEGKIPCREIEESRFFPLGAVPEDTTPGTRRRLEEFTNGGKTALRW